ncbi:TIGR04076 family protein [Thermodesulfobacteriota bacterium]
MEEIHDVAVKVISQKGHCAMGHKVGDEWVIKDYCTPAGICMGAFDSIFPVTSVMAFDGKYPWCSDPDAAEVACSDAQNPVVFEVRRLRK